MPERVRRAVGVSPTLVPWKGSVEGRGGCPTRKAGGAGGPDLHRTNDPGHQVSPAPLSAVFIPRRTWLPLLGDQGLQGVTGSLQFLQAVRGFSARPVAKGRLAVTIFCGDTWRLVQYDSTHSCSLGPSLLCSFCCQRTKLSHRIGSGSFPGSWRVGSVPALSLGWVKFRLA